ncbi:sodium:solute symporter family protein [Sphingobacterium psychroaquaticum]|uniref:Na+/proline symporter n=1 Tax=Sphingobacterium psychroaquaticum TaxID=561061 RepID=A0A1X7K4Q7_9SPHI|nr:sodium:solute symporter family protein [Sphingobacterium psychroaquaticum]SMG35996.1 Na+/proline symporter [Sphingobacterium psychroaquaticum]
MQPLDYIIIVVFFLLLIGIGIYSYFKVSSSADFFTAGGKLPWWLSGISHHVSGYSGAVFVAYASIAYTHGFVMYVWWALTIAIAMIGTIFFIAPRWARLRSKTGIQSPTEYLGTRYNLPTQQLMAWSGVIVKLFDVGAKWAAVGILLNAFMGVPIVTGIILSGVVTLFYVTLGGLWADVLNDFVSFIIQVASGLVMFIIVLVRLGDGPVGVLTMWDRLPAEHSNWFNSPYTVSFAIAFLVINFFSYSGGTWNLATRFISSPSGKDAKKAAILSAVLYLIWPLILFYPMFAAPIFFPNLENPETSYSLMAMEFLPSGLLGLLVASLFSTTLSMTSSDANTISSVITRDILPVIMKKVKFYDKKQMLLLARVTTFSFILLTIIIAFNAKSFGGVIGLIISWFAALLGPISIPMILGLLPAFKHSGSIAAILSIVGGLFTFVVIKIVGGMGVALELAGPLMMSLALYIGYACIVRKKVPEKVEQLLQDIDVD